MPEELTMQEAALLPESDPLRQEWERRIALSPPELQAQWRELLKNSQQARLSLRDISLPEGLRSTLLSLPASGELEAAALLAENDPVRHEIQSRLVIPSAMPVNGTASHPAATSVQWHNLLNETENLRQALLTAPDARIPQSLQKRLLALPQTRRWWQVSAPIRWAAAAIILVLLYYGGQFGWTQYQAFQDRRELDQVASLVVSQHPTPPTALVQSQEETVVLEALVKQGIPMPPIMVQYRRGGSHITGGGVTTFNGEKAYFTLWEWHGQQYTLYQFMPSTFHLRDNFVEHESTVAAPSHAPTATSPAQYHVWYWSEPDHHCGWAAVAAGTSIDNPFVWND